MGKNSADIWIREIIAGQNRQQVCWKKTQQTALKWQLFESWKCYSVTNKSTILIFVVYTLVLAKEW